MSRMKNTEDTAVQKKEQVQASAQTSEAEADFPPETRGGGFGDDIMSDFNTDEEYKPAPLVPNGKYKGNIIGVEFNGKDQTIDWKVTLDNNGGLMNDGESPIDGNQLDFRNWLPIPGDEAKPTKKGNQSTRQAKINMLTRFAQDMKIDMSTPKKIMNSIMNSEWIGLAVNVEVEIREWNGAFFNGIKNMKV